MARGKEDPEEMRKAIIKSRGKGTSIRGIAKALHLATTTVWRIIHLQKETGSITPKPRPGRPSQVTPADSRALRRITQGHRWLTAAELNLEWTQSSTGKETSVATCCRAVRKLGYHFRKVCFW